MGEYLLSRECRDDLFELWSYLASHADIELAGRVESVLFDRFAPLARSPGIGHSRQDLTSLPVLFYRAHPYQYMIIYRRTQSSIEIIALLHARRDMTEILDQRADL
jgi:plasmid stabilization system protein ParE